MSGAGNPPAGWYPDPTQAGSERWWDGMAWSQQTRLSPVEPSSVPIQAQAPAPITPTPLTPAPSIGLPGVPGAPATPIPAVGVDSGSPPKKARSTGLIVALIAALGLVALIVAVAVAGLLITREDADVAATKTTSGESETTVPPDATATTEATIADAGSDADGTTATGDGIEDVVSCTRVGEDTIILELLNSGDETSSYWLTVGFFDDSGSRLADESSFVNFLRPGERSIEEHFVFEEEGSVCEVLDVDRFPGDSSAEELAEVGECEIAAEPDFFDDFAASLSVTNSSATTSDYSVEVAFVDPDGIRRGTGSVYIEAVRADETAPGDIFSSTDFVEGYSCQVIGVTRTDS